MKKKVLISAIGAALAAAPMFASADATVYGKVHVSVDSIKAEVAPAAPTTPNPGAESQINVASNASRIGFKGSEDLGGGLKAVFLLESEIDASGESSTIGSRNRYAGVAGGFGTVLAGIHDTPMKIIGRRIELFPEYVGDARNITAQSGGPSPGWDARLQNAVAYLSPKFGPVTIAAAYSTDWNGGANVDNNDENAYSISAGFDIGPVFLGVATEKHNLVSATNVQTDESAFRVVADAKFGPARVVALYQTVSDQGGAAGADRNTAGVGASFTLGDQHVIKAQYYMADKTDTATIDNGANMVAIGYDFKASKKTTLYAAYAKTSNDDAGTFTVNGGGHGDTTTPAAGNSPSAVSVGIIVDF